MQFTLMGNAILDLFMSTFYYIERSYNYKICLASRVLHRLLL